MTVFEQGSDRWVKGRTWVDKSQSVHQRLLSGTSMQGGKFGGLRKKRGFEGKSTLIPLPVQGLCTRSTNQWTAGILNQIWPTNPCLTNNDINDYTGLTFQTRRLNKPVSFRGPINAHLFVSSIGGDGMLSVTVSDVAPDGTVSRLTGGWQVISHRKLVRSKSRYLDGKLIQPWHPFTKAARKKLKSGQIAPVDVEIFPTTAVIQKGHRLRFTVAGFDVPHLLAPIPDLPGQALPITLYTGPKHPSADHVPGAPEVRHAGRGRRSATSETKALGAHRDALAPVAHERDLAAVDAELVDEPAAQAGDDLGLAGDPGVEPGVRGVVDRHLGGLGDLLARRGVDRASPTGPGRSRRRRPAGRSPRVPVSQAITAACRLAPRGASPRGSQVTSMPSGTARSRWMSSAVGTSRNAAPVASAGRSRSTPRIAGTAVSSPARSSRVAVPGDHSIPPNSWPTRGASTISRSPGWARSAHSLPGPLRSSRLGSPGSCTTMSTTSRASAPEPTRSRIV